MGNEPKLEVKLRRGWRQVENSGGPITHVREGSASSGSLQFSLAQYRHGSLPHAGEKMLIALCEKLTGNVSNRREVLRRSGKCNFGIFGTVAVKGDAPVYFQVWVVSNQREFIQITHTCASEPDPEEIAEANDIALMTGFG